MKTMRLVLIITVVALTARLATAANTNVISFAYTTSIAADASTPDTWTRVLNDGYWTNGVADAVRYNGDVSISVDLGRRLPLSQVDLYTYSQTGAQKLSTSSATLEYSQDQTTWISLGSLTSQGSGHFSISADMFWVSPRYLRLNCVKSAGADGQLIAEIVVSSSRAKVDALLPFSYTTWIPAHPTLHKDPDLLFLKDGKWSSASVESVQYGVNPASSAVPGNPAQSVATNVWIKVDLNETNTLRSAHLYAYNQNAGSYGTEKITLSNSLDGITWSCLGEYTLYEKLADSAYSTVEVSRFDFILPNIQSRYLAFVCKTKSGQSRQLLGEIQIQRSSFESQVSDPIYYTYEFNQPTTFSHENTDCPKLTELAWTDVTANALRFTNNVEITADLGRPMYIAGAELICWSNKFSQSEDYYGTGRVVVNSSLDKTNWTELTEITERNKQDGVYRFTTTFEKPPYARYLRVDSYLCDGSATGQDFTAQIIGQLLVYRPKGAILGEAPAHVANAISFAGFESDPTLPEGGLVTGGTTNGWTFSLDSEDEWNFSGFQSNNSVASTNIPFQTVERYYAPEGSQTAIMMGTGTMETQINVPQNGDYKLQFQLNACVYNRGERGGYDFRITLDGNEIAVIQVRQLSFVEHALQLRNLAAGSYTLRFEGIHSINMRMGVLIDDLQLLRYALPAEQVTTQGGDFTLMADSLVPLTLSYSGAIQVGELWIDGVHMPKGRYSADINPTIFDGPGFIGFNRGTLMLVQ